MANFSIPNSSLANGRISTMSSRRSRKQNRQPHFSVSVVRRLAFSPQKQHQVLHVESVLSRRAALQSALRARKIQSVIRSRADGTGETEGKAAMGSSERVGRRASFNRQSAIRRVKGAWWPSRSSKPSSPCKWRGRFDSYPLRLLIFDFRLPIADCHIATALRAVQQRRR
jgi:hypothetical protein